MALDRYKVLTFDVYGTLIDWETGLLAALRPWIDSQGVTLGNDELLAEFGALELAAERATPRLRYPELLAQVHAQLCIKLGIATNDEAARQFGTSVGDWPAFADSAAALAYLKDHYRLVVLSNVDNDSIRRSIAKLGVSFDAVLTAEDMGSYKPDLRNFGYALDRIAAMGWERSHWLHMAQSLTHDHRPANLMGIDSVWIDRRKGQGGGAASDPEGSVPTWTLRFTSLGDFADFHRRQFAADGR